MQPSDDAYRVWFAPRAERDLDALHPDVAYALYLHATHAIANAPWRCGGPLKRRYEGCLGAHRGEYRVIYRVNDDTREVEIVRAGHRRDVYGGG